MNRQYSNPKSDAMHILTDCVYEGESTGWSGSKEHFEALQNILNKFNVRYVDDFFGTWKLIES